MSVVMLLPGTKSLLLPVQRTVTRTIVLQGTIDKGPNNKLRHYSGNLTLGNQRIYWDSFQNIVAWKIDTIVCYYEDQSKLYFENGHFVKHSKNIYSGYSDNDSVIRGARLVCNEETVSMEARSGVIAPGTGITGSCEIPDMVLGTELRSSGRAISPQPQSLPSSPYI
ncbi:hypothetical protein STEG23_026885 [Scotinomys teguina]